MLPTHPRAVTPIPTCSATLHTAAADTHITVTAGALGFQSESLFTRGLASVARAVEGGALRFKVSLRTHDDALAAEWLAVRWGPACLRCRALRAVHRMQCCAALCEPYIACSAPGGLAGRLTDCFATDSLAGAAHGMRTAALGGPGSAAGCYPPGGG